MLVPGGLHFLLCVGATSLSALKPDDGSDPEPTPCSRQMQDMYRVGVNTGTRVSVEGHFPDKGEPTLLVMHVTRPFHS